MNDDWLLMLNRDGTIEAVDGGAPASWVSRRASECADLPEAVRAAARQLLRDLSQPLSSALVRRIRVAPEREGAPSFTLLAVEAVLIRPAPVAIEPMIQRLLEPLAAQGRELGVVLDVKIASSLPKEISIDPDKIGWAVTTLAGNALRHVRRDGSILVRVAHAAAQSMVSISVQDDGSGMPPAVSSWLIEPNPETGKTTGVALRLVHDIVAAHGGGMVVRSSTEPGERGTTITLWLPARV